MSEQTPLRRAARLCAAAAAALLLCLAAAWLCPARADLDRIRSYTVTVDPRADGSADITYDIDWEVIGGSAEEPLSWVRIGLANGEVDSFENLTPETVSGVRYSGDGGGSFARVTFKKRYYPPDYAAASGQESRVQFAFRVHQSQLYTLNEDGTASYVFTPGWFSDLSIDEMTVRWRADEGVTADATDSEDGYFVWRFGALGHDARATVRVRVPAAAAAAFDRRRAELRADGPDPRLRDAGRRAAGRVCAGAGGTFPPALARRVRQRGVRLGVLHKRPAHHPPGARADAAARLPPRPAAARL